MFNLFKQPKQKTYHSNGLDNINKTIYDMEFILNNNNYIFNNCIACKYNMNQCIDTLNSTIYEYQKETLKNHDFIITSDYLDHINSAYLKLDSIKDGLYFNACREHYHLQNNQAELTTRLIKYKQLQKQYKTN